MVVRQKRGIPMPNSFHTVWTAALFVLVVVPAAALLRIMGKDPLTLRRKPQAPSYWVPSPPQAAVDAHTP